MQINIAICDDELEVCSQVETLLENIFKEKLIEYSIDVYSKGETLCDEMRRTEYDLVFLDIELPEMNGVDIGKFIREELKNEKVQIAYISAKEGYAMELFEYRPINFLVKPLDKEKIERIIRKYLIVSEQNNYQFSFRIKRDIFKVQLSKILYFEARGRKIAIITTEGEQEFYDSMENVYQQVKGRKFLFIHKSIIVNYEFIKRIGYEEVMMTNGIRFSISQSRRKAIRTMFADIKREEK